MVNIGIKLSVVSKIIECFHSSMSKQEKFISFPFKFKSHSHVSLSDFRYLILALTCYFAKSLFPFLAGGWLCCSALSFWSSIFIL